MSRRTHLAASRSKRAGLRALVDISSLTRSARTAARTVKIPNADVQAAAEVKRERRRIRNLNNIDRGMVKRA